MAVSPVPNLAVEKKPFLNALKSLRISVLARQKDEAIISFSDGVLRIRIQDEEVEVPASGSWTGSAKIVARTLIPIVTFPPDPDPLPLRFEDERFFIAGWSVNGTWHAEGVREFSVPSDATDVELAALRRRYGDEQLEEAGLLHDARNAEQSLRQQVAQAAKILSGSGISEEDLLALVERKVKRETEKPGGLGCPIGDVEGRNRSRERDRVPSRG